MAEIEPMHMMVHKAQLSALSPPLGCARFQVGTKVSCMGDAWWGAVTYDPNYGVCHVRCALTQHLSPLFPPLNSMIYLLVESNHQS